MKLLLNCAVTLKNIVVFCLILSAFVLMDPLAAGDSTEKRGEMKKLEDLQKAGNWRELREGAEKLLDAMSSDDPRAGSVWNLLCAGMFRGNEVHRYDAAFEKYAAGKFARNIRFFTQAAWAEVPGYGIMLDNKFKRGPNRGNAGRDASSYERDRVQVLALMAALIPQAEKDVTLRSAFFLNMSKLLLQNRNSGSSYKLQHLTDLRKLPDYETDEGRIASVSRPPVAPDGSPVFYRLPASWKDAANDGERLRFAVDRADCEEALRLWADFLCGQFDFLTANLQLREEYYRTPAMKQYLYDLKDNETISELADGVRRITLPDEFNYIEMYKKMGRQCYFRLGEIYAARMQFEKAAAYFQKSPFTLYAGQLLDSWGMPEKLHVVPAGTDCVIPYYFRNAKQVTVRLYRVDMDKAVARMLELQKDPETRSVGDIRWLARRSEKTKLYWQDLIGETPEIIRTFDLQPLPHHWENVAYLAFGKLLPGAFVAEFVPDGNGQSRVDSLLWAADLALSVSQGAGNGNARIFVNDPVSGKPVPGATLKIYSFYHGYGRKKGQQTQEVLTFKTGANGIAEFSPRAFDPPENSRPAGRYILAETDSGKRTLLSCSNFWFADGDRYDENPRTFVITDKTVYKPGDSLALTGYRRIPSYSGNMDRYNGKTVTLQFTDPQGKNAFTRTVPFDAAAQCFTAEMKLPADAVLGWWHADIREFPGNIRFKVEEFQKPEYLLTVKPPAKPVKAGEKIPVTMVAQYYFGSPVADAEISYRVFRSECVEIYPFAFFWNWLYGERYAVCTAFFQNQTEQNLNLGRVLIRSGSGRTDAQGKFKIEIDSGDAAARFGARNFRYTVEAEVKDSSRRVVTGSGSVIAAVQPFSVSVYTPWGFAKTGERQTVVVKACTPDGQPVRGRGVLRIFRRALNKDGVPARTGEALRTIRFTPGGAEMPEFLLNEEGVYELCAEVVAENGTAVSESVPFFVVGKTQGKTLFGEYPVSISTDKPTYQPGETAEILVACRKPGQTVYFIARSEREAKIECVTLEGHAKLFRVPVNKDDQPNFFVDVMSYQDGKMLTLRKEVVVPPEKKLLNVAIQPAAEKVKPGTELPLRISVTGLDGKPVSGNVTVAVYDKSLEAVSGSPIRQIGSFFWGWRRHGFMYFMHNFGISLPLYFDGQPMLRNVERSFSIPFGRDGESSRRYRRERHFVMEAVGAARAWAPMPEAAAPAAAAMNMLQDAQPSSSPSPVLRTDFRDRAFWAGNLRLPPDGETTISIPVPDNLTTWVVRVWSLTPDTRVGEARSEIVVSKDLIARLTLPRFMVQGDTVNAVVSLNCAADRASGTAAVTLTAPGLLPESIRRNVVFAANGTASFEVPLTAVNAGEYTLTLSAGNGKDADALELKLPVLVKGIEKQIHFCGRLDAGKKKAVISMDIPAQRRPETTSFVLFLSPGAAKNMMELLPYLAADDTGDVFCTVNRFLPVLTAKAALQKLGIRWADAVPGKTERDPLYAEYMQRFSGRGNAVPVFSAEDFERVAAESHRMIRKMVHADGGWGWFGAYRETSWPDTTAYVVDALLELRDDEDKTLVRNGVAWLERHAARRVAEIRKYQKVCNTDALVARVLARAGKPAGELMALCYQHRVACLAPYGYAMLALAYGRESSEAKTLLRNLEQFLMVDDENGTACLNIPTSCSFFWYGNENETQAAWLELLLREDPASVLAQKAAKYLVTNVRNSPWRNSTRSLGAAVRALAKFIVTSGEGNPDFTVTVRTGSGERQYVFQKQNMWQKNGPALFLPAEKLSAGKHTVELEFSGTGALYWNGTLQYFSLEDRMEPAGLEMKIRRNYYRLVPESDAGALLAGKRGAAVAEKVLKYNRILLKDGETVRPGDLLEVELISTAKNDYDYVVFQDAMPAGFVYENPVSGWKWSWAAPMYAEYKERGARFYLRNMARGESNAFYRIRAQLCGTVTALPARGYGIYAPELKCNSAQQTLRTMDEK